MKEGIIKRFNPKDEVWFLRINGENIWQVETKTKRERVMLSSIRKLLIAYGYPQIELTNREKYIKNLNISQEKLLKMKANNRFIERQVLKEVEK